MSKPRQLYASDPNEFKSGVYVTEPGDDFRQVLFIEKTAYDKVVEALKEYADGCWYPHCFDEGYRAKEVLKELEEL